MEQLIYFIVLIGVLIFVHELGHFLFAKLFHVKVLKFSIGFGPKVLGFKWGETEYCISLFPLGGLVKILGQDPDEKVSLEELNRSYSNKPLWQRFLIIVAGPVFNLIFPLFIYIFFFLNHSDQILSVVGEVIPGMPAAEIGMRPNDIIVRIADKKIHYWEELQRELERKPKALPIEFLREGKILKREVTPVVYQDLNRIKMKSEKRVIGISPYYQGTQICLWDKDSPAAKAGLENWDIIVAVNGKKVEKFFELENFIKANPDKEFELSVLRRTEFPYQFATITYLTPVRLKLTPTLKKEKGYTGLDNANQYVYEVMPETPAEKTGLKIGDKIHHWTVDKKRVYAWERLAQEMWNNPNRNYSVTYQRGAILYPAVEFKPKYISKIGVHKEKIENYIFGARAVSQFVLGKTEKHHSRLGWSLKRSVEETVNLIGLTLIGFYKLISGEISLDTIGGPIMIYKFAGTAAQEGIEKFLFMMAFISINLGILNLLPIPILDGGHVLFIIIEFFNRKPVSTRIREISFFIGFVLLILLMVFAFKNDIERYWKDIVGYFQ